VENVELLGWFRHVAPSLLYTGNIPGNEGVSNETVDRDDVQKGPGAQNQTAGLHLQTVWRAHLFPELSQASPRSPRALYSLIAIAVDNTAHTVAESTLLRPRFKIIISNGGRSDRRFPFSQPAHQTALSYVPASLRRALGWEHDRNHS
jgi:hypothetical protein